MHNSEITLNLTSGARLDVLVRDIVQVAQSNTDSNVREVLTEDNNTLFVTNGMHQVSGAMDKYHKWVLNGKK